MPDTFPVAVTYLADHVTFLTDRWGDPVGEGEETEPEEIAALGLTREEIEWVSEQHTHIFSAENSFLVYCPDPAIFPTAVDDPFAIFIEFEIAEDFLPDIPMRDARSPEEIAAWRAALTFFSPAILHAARGAQARLGDRAGEAQTVFDLTAFYSDSFGFLIPLSLSHMHGDLSDLLFHNDLPFPPSLHAQMGAVTQLRWTAPDEDVDPTVLPGQEIP